MARAVYRHRSVRELGGGPRRLLRRRMTLGRQCRGHTNACLCLAVCERERRRWRERFCHPSTSTARRPVRLVQPHRGAAVERAGPRRCQVVSRSQSGRRRQPPTSPADLRSCSSRCAPSDPGFPGDGDKHVADEDRADTCLRARARIRRWRCPRGRLCPSPGILSLRSQLGPRARTTGLRPGPFHSVHSRVAVLEREAVAVSLDD
jgi:hypothetical protein